MYDAYDLAAAIVGWVLVLLGMAAAIAGAGFVFFAVPTFAGIAVWAFAALLDVR